MDEPRRVGIVVDEGLHNGNRQAVPLLNYNLAICLITEEKHGKPQLG
jgi:hypothetical protein